jgi:hypothetical protein
MTEKLNREYTITFDSTDASYVARCITPKLEWLCGNGDSEESAKKMAEDIIEELRCPDCGHYPAERGSKITKLKARIAELEGVDASLELIAVLKVLEQCKSAMEEAEEGLRTCYQVSDYPANGSSTQDYARTYVRAALAAIAEVQKPFVAQEPDPNVRYLLTAPVPHGNAWWNIVRQIRRDEEWIPSPDFALVNVSIRTPNAEAVARKLLSDLQASSKEEA